MNKKIVIANWKMQLPYQEALKFASDFKKKLENYKLENLEIGICADFLSIPELAKIFKDTKIKLGSQNVSWENRGAYTGEISILDLKEFNTELFLIGHSERRQNFHESDKNINKKIKKVIENGKTPILCIGENLEQRRNNQKDLVIIEQVNKALSGIKFEEIKQLIVAYEPIWSISTTKFRQDIEVKEVEYSHKIMREAILDTLFKEDEKISLKEFKNKIRLIFGGSANASNVSDLMKQSNVDGVLVGGASLKVSTFMDLINTLI